MKFERPFLHIKCRGIYNNPYSPLLIYFTQINGGGGGGYASDSGDARICQRGAKARVCRYGRGCPPSHGRDILKFRVSKWPFFYSPFSLILKISQCENLGKNRAKFGQNLGIIRANIWAPFCFLLACQNILSGI